MKEVISITTFFTLFFTLHTIVSWMFPFLNLGWLLAWLLIGIISLIISKFLYEWLERQEEGYLPPKRRNLLFFLIVIVGLSLVAVQYWNEYKEKPFSEVLAHYSYPDQIMINPYEGTDPITNKSTIDDLLNFLSQYDVQKVKNDNGERALSGHEIVWDNDKGLNGPAVVKVLISEENIWVNFDRYKVINGPIDLELIEQSMTMN